MQRKAAEKQQGRMTEKELAESRRQRGANSARGAEKQAEEALSNLTETRDQLERLRVERERDQKQAQQSCPSRRTAQAAEKVALSRALEAEARLLRAQRTLEVASTSSAQEIARAG